MIKTIAPILIIIVFAGWWFYNQSKNKAKVQAVIAQSQDVQLIDVRTPGEFASESIPGSLNIPLANLSSRLNEIDKSRPIIVYCQSGVRSRSAFAILIDNGFQNVTDGGGIGSVKSVLNK